MQTFFHRCTLALVAGILSSSAWALPKIAVTDLTYEDKVSGYFRIVAAHEKSRLRASGSNREQAGPYSYSAGRHTAIHADSESSYFETEGTYSYVQYGELRKFSADVKGELLKSGAYRVVQGRPYTLTRNEKIYDVVDRIKKGFYRGADYVLFGTLSSIQFREESNPVIGTDSTSQTLGLELVADYSLIDTRTYEVKAAFSAMGEGQDVRLVGTRGGQVTMNRGKVIAEVSKSLAQDVARQLGEQFAPEQAATSVMRGVATEAMRNTVTVYR